MTGIEIKKQGDNGALFSPNGKCRYLLWRVWDTEKPVVAFVGLNPSTANHETDDPTIVRVKAFAKDAGYGGVYMVNLYPMITPDPGMLDISMNIGQNNYVLREYINSVDAIVLAWGAFPVARAIVQSYRWLFKKKPCYALGINKDYSPKHPLYLPASTRPRLIEDQDYYFQKYLNVKTPFKPV